MSQRLQEIVCLALRLTCVPWFIRNVYARHKITIVNYHNPAPEVFERHIRSFARTYSFITIDQLLEALGSKDFYRLPPKPMVVTLDDGRVGNARLFDAIEKYRVPVVLYAVAGIVNTNRGFWFDQLFHNYELTEQMKCLPDKERRALLAQKYGFTDDRDGESPAALSLEQLRKFIEIGGTVCSHTVFHPILSKCDEEVGQYECAESRKMLETMLNRPVVHFALPNGSSDERTRNWLVNAGYMTSRSVESHWVTPNSDPLNLPNFGVSDDAGVHKAMVQACGVWSLLRKCAMSLLHRV
jgi:peptidoglycan/xylan/chitin deacetylase (PgdA/CDA1 family)